MPRPHGLRGSGRIPHAAHDGPSQGVRGADTLVLGCTHYPFLSDAIRLTAGPGIRLIDPAPAVARQLKRRLDEPGLLNDTKKAPARIFCTTDANEARERILRLLWTDNAVLQKLDGSVRP